MTNMLVTRQLLLHTLSGRPFTADITFADTSTTKPLVIFLHGFKGFKDWGHFNLVAEYFALQGFAFFKLNFSHNGTTPTQPTDLCDLEAFGQNNFSKELADIEILQQHIQQLATEHPAWKLLTDKQFFIGHSRGGAVAMLAAAENENVLGAASWAGVSNFENRWSNEELKKWKDSGCMHVQNSRTGQELPMYYQIVEDYYANKERLHIGHAAAKLNKRLLIIHGTNDSSLPVEMAHELKQAAPEAKLLLVENADHSFGGYHPFNETKLPEHTNLICEQTAQFFKQLLNG